MHRFAFLMLMTCAGLAFAQPDPFLDQAASQYRAILARASAIGELDHDRALLDRVRQISAGLIAAAEKTRPSTAAWSWEIHVTSEPSATAFCMAGGKVLVGTRFARRLELTDGELAMLLAHEMAHALAGHRRERARGDMESDAAGEIREKRIAVMQENEADEIGMKLALRAGWPPASLVSFYDKLAALESPGELNSSHSPAAQRAEAARELAGRQGR